MERAVALKKLTKLLGKSLSYRVDAKAPSRDEREAARLELPAAVQERNNLRERMDARRKAILEGDAEYQALQTSFAAARDRAEKISSITRHYKFTVGTSNGMFFMHSAEGDSWEEVIEKVAAKKAGASIPETADA